VTSPRPGEGKTLTAANLAVVHAQAGYRTVLVSADFRRPTIERLFGYESKANGFTNCLAVQLEPRVHGNGMNGNGHADVAPGATNGHGTGHYNGTVSVGVENMLLRSGIPNLLLLPAGPVPPNPAELLASARSKAVIDRLAEIADVVIIDSPPVLAVTDAAVLAAYADGVLLVASLGESKRGELASARRVLDTPGIRLLGTVINKARNRDAYSAYYTYAPPAEELGRRARRRARQTTPPPKPKAKAKAKL
jgi:Mrp family chromosome partitioning ATPase